MARFELGRIDTRRLSQLLADTVRTRIEHGRDVNDQPTRPLNPRYARRKARRGLKPVRNLKFTGRTLRALAAAGRPGEIRVEVRDAIARRRLAGNPGIFGQSRRDHEVIIAATVAEFRKSLRVVR